MTFSEASHNLHFALASAVVPLALVRRLTTHRSASDTLNILGSTHLSQPPNAPVTPHLSQLCPSRTSKNSGSPSKRRKTTAFKNTYSQSYTTGFVLTTVTRRTGSHLTIVLRTSKKSPAITTKCLTARCDLPGLVR